MKSHDLAHKLLALPNIEVYVLDGENGNRALDEVTSTTECVVREATVANPNGIEWIDVVLLRAK